MIEGLKYYKVHIVYFKDYVGAGITSIEIS